MNLTINQSINMAILQDIHQHNQLFISQAIKEWDRIGHGCFALFVQLYVNQRWHLMTQSN